KGACSHADHRLDRGVADAGDAEVTQRLGEVDAREGLVDERLLRVPGRGVDRLAAAGVHAAGRGQEAAAGPDGMQAESLAFQAASRRCWRSRPKPRPFSSVPKAMPWWWMCRRSLRMSSA